MSKVTFKQFNSYISQDLSEEQLDEIFGKFFGRDEAKLDQLKAKKLALQKATDAKKKQIQAAKDAQWAQAKNRVSNPQQKPDPLMTKSTSDMRAGERRAVDRNPFGLAFESVMSTIDQDLSEVFPRLESGEIDLYDLLRAKTSHYISADTRLYLQHMYDEIASEKRLHPDDDFEQIFDHMMDQLSKEYSEA